MPQITFAPNFSAWQRVARSALAQRLSPNDIFWQELASAERSLALHDEMETSRPASFRVPRKFLHLARVVSMHADEAPWALLYRLLWRLTHGDPKLLEVFVDSDVARAFAMEKSVRHDIHKMRAFVRFREVTRDNEKWFVAWFEPAHHIVEHNATFFVDRFASMRWSILTSDICAQWDGAELSFTAGVAKSETPNGDQLEDLWRTYYANIFNPARVKVHAMQAEMPKRYWRNLPETAVIPALLQEAPHRVAEMMKRSAARATADDDDKWAPAPVPDTSNLAEVERAAKVCTACHLYKRGTQTVFGEGPKRAPLMLVGEQPGDQEDLAGKPFVGPAGKFWIAPSKKPVLIATRFTSPMWSNISNGSRAGGGGFTKNQTRAKLRRAGRGWKRSFDSLGRNCWFALVPLPRRRSLVRLFASRAIGEKFWSRNSRHRSSPPCIRRHSSVSPMKNRASANTIIR